MNVPQIQTGLSCCCEELPPVLRDGKIGLLLNQASVDSDFRLSCDVLSTHVGSRLMKLFSPQHGLWGVEQANMIESPHDEYLPLRIPVFSLYADARRPTEEMLDGLDCLVIDLQDVGTRVYTFIWTMLECLHACADAGVAVVVLDRPNPLGGAVFEGPILLPEFCSFVGNAEIPMRHGLTIGELARLFKGEQQIDVDLHVISIRNWRRETIGWNSAGSWVPPSPNMPRWETAALYPGQVLLEGTNLSEGRGTTAPFEVIGAPFLDGHALEAALGTFEIPGVVARAVKFRPTFDKFANQICEGVRLHVTNRDDVRSFAMTVRILQVIREIVGEQLQWLPPPYEYEYERSPIDILYGSDRLRIAIDNGDSRNVGDLTSCDVETWLTRTSGVRLYE